MFENTYIKKIFTIWTARPRPPAECVLIYTFSINQFNPHHVDDLTEFVFDIVFDGFSLINRTLNHYSNPSYNNSMDGSTWIES